MIRIGPLVPPQDRGLEGRPVLGVGDVAGRHRPADPWPFVRLEPERALVVMVSEDGQVENRILPIPAGLPTSA